MFPSSYLFFAATLRSDRKKPTRKETEDTKSDTAATNERRSGTLERLFSKSN
jgi:hypothetical protein